MFVFLSVTCGVSVTLLPTHTLLWRSRNKRYSVFSNAVLSRTLRAPAQGAHSFRDPRRALNLCVSLTCGCVTLHGSSFPFSMSHENAALASGKSSMSWLKATFEARPFSSPREPAPVQGFPARPPWGGTLGPPPGLRGTPRGWRRFHSPRSGAQRRTQLPSQRPTPSPPVGQHRAFSRDRKSLQTPAPSTLSSWWCSSKSIAELLVGALVVWVRFV